MKKLFYLMLLSLAIVGCSKKSSPTTSKPVPTVSGKFKLVQNSDTLYKNDNIADGVAEVLNQNAMGDTAYLNPATPQLVVQPNPIVDYDAVTAMTDTLNFTSTTAGVEITSMGSHPFTYNLSTNFYYSGIADGTISEKVYKINATTVKLTITQRDGNYIGSTKALFYTHD